MCVCVFSLFHRSQEQMEFISCTPLPNTKRKVESDGVCVRVCVCVCPIFSSPASFPAESAPASWTPHTRVIWCVRFCASTQNLFQIEADCSVELQNQTEDVNKSADSVWTRSCVSDGEYITGSALSSEQRKYYTKNSINSLTDTSQYHVEVRHGSVQEIRLRNQ